MSIEPPVHEPELDEPAELPPSPAGPRPPIRLSDRVIALGKTGSGKSELLAHLFAIHGGQRFLIDVQDAYELGPIPRAEGFSEAQSVRDIDWSQRTIRYIPRGTQRDYDDVYAAIYQTGNLLVWLDEAYGPTTASKCPTWLRRVITQGRKRTILHLAATQRPAHILPDLISQAEHAFVFELPPYEADLRAVALRFGMTTRDLASTLASLDRVRGLPTAEPTGYLRHDLGQPQILRMPPLPAGIIAATRRHILT